jgi:hypothetical protein
VLHLVLDQDSSDHDAIDEKRSPFGIIITLSQYP